VLNTIALGVKGKIDLVQALLLIGQVQLKQFIRQQQVYQLFLREIQHRQHLPDFHYTFLLNSVQIHPHTQLDGFMVIEFTLPEINTGLTCWLME
jgi:hypothetical protein